MMSVQHRNEHFQEVVGYTGLKLWNEFRSAGRYLGVMDGTGDIQNHKRVCVCIEEGKYHPERMYQEGELVKNRKYPPLWGGEEG